MESTIRKGTLNSTLYTLNNRYGQSYAVSAISRLIALKLSYIGGHWQIETGKMFCTAPFYIRIRRKYRCLLKYFVSCWAKRSIPRWDFARDNARSFLSSGWQHRGIFDVMGKILYYYQNKFPSSSEQQDGEGRLIAMLMLLVAAHGNPYRRPHECSV